MVEKFDLSSNIILSKKQRFDLYYFCQELIESLPEKALQELLSGYENDIDKLFGSITKEAYRVLYANLGSDIDSEATCYLENLQKSFSETLKRVSYNYFKASMLSDFNMGWRNLEWGNLIQRYPYINIKASRGSGKSYETCFAFPLWRLYRYYRPSLYQKQTLNNRNSRETVLITNELSLAKKHLSKIVEEIKTNELFHEVLLPKVVSDLGKDKLIAKNGATIELRSKDSTIRGLHVGAVVVDDFLDKSALYSKEQRDKFEEVFYAEIVNIVEPKGHLIVAGTPFFISDLYGRISEDKNFKSFTYPGIYENGDLLAPDRHTLKYILDLKESLGSVVFSREVLVNPISDASSLFPYEYLNKALIGMDNVRYVDNIDSYPNHIKLEKVVTACDFAFSGNIGADSCAFVTVGRGLDKKFYLLNVFRGQGVSHNEQISHIVSIRHRFKPNEVVAEDNGAQTIMVGLLKERGVDNVYPFTTTASIKKDLYNGLPSISAIFERGDIKCPYGDEKSKIMTDLIFSEFNAVTFNEDNGKLENVNGHDDVAMAIFMAITRLREETNELKVHII